MIKRTYNVSGMTCNGCLSKVQSLLSNINGVNQVDIDLAKGEAEIAMANIIPDDVFKTALKNYPKYQITAAPAINHAGHHHIENEASAAEEKPWFVVYKPILLIFGYILLISLIAANSTGGFRLMNGMRVFMAGFFLTFSFFKMLDLDGFAESYAMYDIIAKRVKSWGYIYVFIEILLGISFALNFQPFITNIVTLIIMTVSIIGVLQSVLNKTKIRCACLGAVFNLPMSAVTIIEDGLMIAMSIAMLFLIS